MGGRQRFRHVIDEHIIQLHPFDAVFKYSVVGFHANFFDVAGAYTHVL
jgi:hypothetical protein